MNRLSFSRGFAVLLASLLFEPSRIFACGCGCGMFDVQSESMAPAPDRRDSFPIQSAGPSSVEPGNLLYFEYDNGNQNQNWSGTKPSSSDNNSDKLLRTDFITAGGQYMLNDRWGLMAEVPAWSRDFKTSDVDGNPASFHDTSIADIRVRGVYSGLSSDLTTGITFGAKLPTGNIKAAGFDRDSQIGTGSTDLLLGGYHLGLISAAPRWMWFGNILLDQPVMIAGGYRPGGEADFLLGGSYRGYNFAGVQLSPMAQAIASLRSRDSGPLAHSEDTGYSRILAGPGLHLAVGRLIADATVNFPLAQNINGNQLTAAQYWRLSAGVRF